MTTRLPWQPWREKPRGYIARMERGYAAIWPIEERPGGAWHWTAIVPHPDPHRRLTGSPCRNGEAGSRQAAADAATEAWPAVELEAFVAGLLPPGPP